MICKAKGKGRKVHSESATFDIRFRYNKFQVVNCKL
jgi:hypothetical protein